MLFLGAFLAVLGLGGGPLWSQMGDIVWVDTDETGRGEKEIAYEILLWDGPILLTYDSDKGKRVIFGRVSGRFGAGRGSLVVPDG